jgi:hypothetical protein
MKKEITTNERSMDIHQYREKVEELAKTDSPIVFYNSSADHAAVVMQTIVKNAQKNIDILAGDLSSLNCQSENFIIPIVNFILSGGKIRILLDEVKGNDLPKNELFDALKAFQDLEDYKEKVQIRKSLTSITIKGSDSSEKIHFTVSDSKAYRIENDTVNFTAKCCFNDPLQSQKLINTFDLVFLDNSHSISF